MAREIILGFSEVQSTQITKGILLLPSGVIAGVFPITIYDSKEKYCIVSFSALTTEHRLQEKVTTSWWPQQDYEAGCFKYKCSSSTTCSSQVKSISIYVGPIHDKSDLMTLMLTLLEPTYGIPFASILSVLGQKSQRPILSFI